MGWLRKPAISVEGGWSQPRRARVPREVPPTFKMQTENRFQSLAEEPLRESNTPELVVRSRSRSPRLQTKRVPALKVAGSQPRRKLNPSVLKETEIKVNQKGIENALKAADLSSVRFGGPKETAQQDGPGVHHNKETEKIAVRVLERPHKPSYFLPGRLEGRPVQFLIDTGCTTNLLSKQVFDRLPGRIRDLLEESDSHGLLADGTQLPFYGVIRLQVRVRDVKTEDVFVVSQISEDAILGMPFLVAHNCSMDFNQPVVQVDGRKLTCTDRHGRLLLSNLQVTREVVVPPRTEMNIQCRVAAKNFSPVGLIEGNPGGLPVASSLNRPSWDGGVVARCLNLTEQPMMLRAGSVIGTFTGVEKDQIDDSQLLTDSEETTDQFASAVGEEVPGHLQQLLGAAVGDNKGPGKSLVSARLLTEVPGHLQQLFGAAVGNCKGPGESQKLARLLTEYSTVFSTGDGDVGRTTLVEHSIPVEAGTRPIRLPPHRLGPEKEAEAERQVKDLLQKGMIEPAGGAWSSPVVLVKKKDGKWRFCVDYRRLNAVTQQDAYPLPRIDDSLDALAGSKYFSTLDLVSGYWQVPLDADAREKSAFATRSGLWKWRVLPFGLTSAPATFQRLMERVLYGLHWKSLLLYLDDIIVIAPDFKTHIQRLEEVFRRLQGAGLKLKPSKCELLQEEVRYLGHIVSPAGVATDPEKAEAVRDWPVPQGVKELQAFLGTVGYYRQYIKNFATDAGPLHRLTAKGVDWEWNETAQTAFDKMKKGLTTAPVLGYPDPDKQYVLDTDASDIGVGAVLSQIEDGVERVIAYYSKTLAPPERNYCVTRKELLAVIKAVKHFRPYIYGRRFRLRTDHASLRWLCLRKEPSNQVARWLEILAEFQYTLEHRAGVKHGNADGLSRRGCGDCRQCDLIERRDGGPSRQELRTASLEAALKVAAPVSSGQARNSADLQISSYIAETDLSDWRCWDFALKVAEPVYPLEPDTFSALKVSGDDCPSLFRSESDRETAEFVNGAIGVQSDLKELQMTGSSSVAVMYRSIQTKTELTSEEISTGNVELRKLNKQRESLRIRPDGILEIRVAPQDKPRWCVVCPPATRRTVIWKTHCLSHSGVNRTINRLQLTWYWPGMTAEVRRTVKSCEKCQVAKHGGTKAAGGRQRLYAGRPWQKVAVDLVGPMSETPRGNKWILVLTDHFTRWQDALALPDATAPVVAAALDERVFCYLGLPEQIHSDQGAQFESQLMTELCRLWNVDKTRTTPYHPQGNGVVERNNRGLGDSLRALLLQRGQDEWDDLLPQLMRAYRGTPHSVTGETANLMMLGRELRLPDQLEYYPPPTDFSPQHEFVVDINERLKQAHEALRQQQLEIRQEDQEKPPLFATEDLVWLENRRRRKGDNSKLQPKFVGPYKVVKVFDNHTYLIDRQGQDSVQNECRLKLYHPCPEEAGKAPTALEPRRRPNMKGTTRHRPRCQGDDVEVLPLEKDNPALLLPEIRPDQSKAIPHVLMEPTEGKSNTEEPSSQITKETLVEGEALPTVEQPASLQGEYTGRPRREARQPMRYGDYECYQIGDSSETLTPGRPASANIRSHRLAYMTLMEKEADRLEREATHLDDRCQQPDGDVDVEQLLCKESTALRNEAAYLRQTVKTLIYEFPN